MTLLSLIIYIGYFLLVINIICYSIRVKIKNFPYRVLFIYLISTAVIQGITEYLGKVYGQNLFMSHYYFIIQFVLLSIYFFNIIKSNKLRKVIKYTSIVALFSLIIQYLTTPVIYNSFNQFEILVCSLPLILYSVFFLFQTLDSKDRKYIFVNSGIFIFILSSTLIFSAGNVMLDLSSEVNNIIWHANVSIYAIYQILIFIEWYKHFRKKEVLD